MYPWQPCQCTAQQNETSEEKKLYTDLTNKLNKWKKKFRTDLTKKLIQEGYET